MLDRVDMNVIDVALEIPVIADRVLPKTTLPKCKFTIGVARDGRARFHSGIRESAFDQSPPIWIIRISRRQRHEDMQVIRQHHDGIDGEGCACRVARKAARHAAM